MLKMLMTAAVSGLIAASALATPASAGGIKAGVLTCKIDGGWGYVLGSHKKVDCLFKPSHGKWRDHYVGSITKFGADVGYTKGARLAWVVFAPGKIGRGAMQGTYVGGTGEATVGIGVGANALFGGFERGFNLQPVSFQGQVGLNAAGGVAGLRLNSH